MILYALILRSRDLLPLTSTTNYHCNGESAIDLKGINRIVKNILKRSDTTKNKCFLRLNEKTYYFLPCLNIICMAMCISSYPQVLAYSFLEELAGEFTKKYDRFKVEQALRPYSLIEFDTTIHPIQQTYNKPQQLTSRINLSEITRDISLDPPQEVFLIEANSSHKNHTHQVIPPTVRVGPLPTLEPLSFLDKTVMVLTMSLIIHSVVDILGVLNSWSSEEETSLDTSWLHFCSILLRLAQLYVLTQKQMYRQIKGWVLFVMLLILGWFLFCEEERWILSLVFIITSFTHVCILRRKIAIKLPQYQI
ncbi:vesicle-trafficking protein SEC22a-like [Daktulosphaira vitifoliae]|uniref:vesicle-trafficking protein SEC22a-like n=1 Tax=Daktulosphaira vitifoliae TaxID=58002 RepID=UPI0021AB031E|nr:vesicle-trafficking protein SEC22a-like [Daktulosphaira vitifoliae]